MRTGDIKRKKFRVIDHRVPNYRLGKLDILNLYEKRNNAYKGKTVAKASQEFYIALKKKYPNLEKYTNKKILVYITEFNKFVAKTTTEYRDGVSLPANLGLMMMCTFGHRTRAINVQLSEQTGKEEYYRNDHSETRIRENL